MPFTCLCCIVAKINNTELNSSVAESKALGERREFVDSVLSDDKNKSSSLNHLPPEAHQKPLENNNKHLVIIDGIKDPTRFQNSRDIQKEIRKYKGGVQMKYVYPLNRGGIAVRVEKEEEVEILKEEWPEEAFSSGSSLSVHENNVIP